MEIIYNELKDWIENISKSINRVKVTVFLNGDVDGYAASKLASKIFGKENVLNVIIPCYSSEKYIVDTSSFSKENEILFNIIGIKHIFDSVMEKDIDGDIDIEENTKEEIINTIRNGIIKSASIKNDSMIFKFNIKEDLFQFEIEYVDKKNIYEFYYNNVSCFSTSNKEVSINKDQLNDLYNFLNDNK